MKQLLTPLMLVAICTSPLLAASYTTVRSGDVTDTSHVTGPWCNTTSPCAVPASGDTVIVANGHVLNLPAGANWTIGNSADLATYALSTAGTGGTGVFTMQAGSALTVRGHVRHGNATWQVGTAAGGAHVTFDHAVTPLIWYISDGTLQANARLVVRGSAGNRSTFKKAVGGVATGGFTSLGGVQNGGRVDMQYVDLSDVGGPSTPAFSPRGTNSAFSFLLDRFSCTRCGQIVPNGVPADSTFSITNFKITSTVVSNSRVINLIGQVPRTTGTRVIRNGYISGGTMFFQAAAINGVNQDWTVENILFQTTGTIPPIRSDMHIGSLVNILTHVAQSTTGGSVISAANVNGFYALEETPYNGNGHPVQGLAYSQTWQKWVIEASNGQLQGDALQTSHSAAIAGQTMTFRDGLVIQPAGTFYGAILNHTATSAVDATHQYPSITARNITWRGGRPGTNASGIAGEANAGAAGLYAAVRNNLVWSEVEATSAYITDYLTLPANGTFGLADYNAYWNIVGPSTRYRYADTTPAVYSAPPGSNDIQVNPRLANTSRNFLSWGRSIDPSHNTWAQILAQMAKLADDAGFDPRYSIANAIAWVRWGYVPQEPRLWVSPDGSYYGGVDPTPLRLAAGATAVAQ